MALRRVLDRDQMVADPADMAERADGRAGVVEQRLFERGIGPRLGDHLGAVMRADPGFIGLDDGIQRRRINVPLLGQDRLQRAHAQFRLRQFGMVVIVVMVVVIVIMFAHGQQDSRKIPAMSRQGLC